MGEKLGTIRATYVVALASIGSFLFAYDTGIVGGILTLASFEKDFGYTAKQQTQVNSNCVSLLQAGAFFGCFFVWPITASLGRRWAVVISSAVFCIGAIFQVINTHSIGAFYAGRVVSGLGTGAATVLVPMYTAEVAPKEIRGKLGSFFQLFFTLGVAVSYWVDYAVSAGVQPSTKQWQIPVGLQLVPGAFLGLGMLLVKESPRWFAKKGKKKEAYEALLWIRGGVDSAAIQAEYTEILTGIEVELHASEGLTWKELLLPSNRTRIVIAISLQLAQQCTGNTSLAYFAPQIFAAVGAGSKSILVTGFFGIVKIIGVLVFILFLVKRNGRKKLFMAGAFAMGLCMLIIAVLVAVHPPKVNAQGIDAYGAASIAMVYLEAFAFNWSWGPLCWLYIGEIFPLRIREIGVATGAASQWLFNFCFSQITPHAIKNLGWKTFLMFAILNFAIVVYAFLVIRETRGKSLEEMEVVFGTISATHSEVRDGRQPSIEVGTPERINETSK